MPTSFKEDTDRIGYLLQALYPDLFPEDTETANRARSYREAIEAREDLKSRALALADALASVRERAAARKVHEDAAMGIFLEVSSRSDLWGRFLQLAEECESSNGCEGR